MVANGSCMQASTIRSLALAWLLTLPLAMFLSAFLIFICSQNFLSNIALKKKPPPLFGGFFIRKNPKNDNFVINFSSILSISKELSILKQEREHHVTRTRRKNNQ